MHRRRNFEILPSTSSAKLIYIGISGLSDRCLVRVSGKSTGLIKEKTCVAFFR